MLLASATASRGSAVDAALRTGLQLAYMRVLADVERLEAGKFLKSEGLKSPERQLVRRKLSTCWSDGRQLPLRWVFGRRTACSSGGRKRAGLSVGSYREMSAYLGRGGALTDPRA